MKKAVILTGGKQYLVSEGDVIDVELLSSDKDVAEFEAMLVIDGEKASIGYPTIKDSKVSAKIIEADTKQEKTTSIRYKAKKRVRTIKGHRQRLAKIQITSIKT